jgi:hypothetical protein
MQALSPRRARTALSPSVLSVSWSICCTLCEGIHCCGTIAPTSICRDRWALACRLCWVRGDVHRALQLTRGCVVVRAALHDRATLWLILGFGALFSVTLTFVYPGTAIDIYTYRSEPHHAPLPCQSHLCLSITVSWRPLMPLADGWPERAPYGPLGIILNALPCSLPAATCSQI